MCRKSELYEEWSVCSPDKKYMQQNNSTHKILRGSAATYVHRAMLRCKDFHSFDSRFTISLMWYETLSLPMTLLET